jgi:hypothetical protein
MVSKKVVVRNVAQERVTREGGYFELLAVLKNPLYFFTPIRYWK